MTLPLSGNMTKRASWRATGPVEGEIDFGIQGNVEYPLYRYTSRGLLNATLLSGNWYLGTLFGYRDLSVIDKSRHDASEGARFDTEVLSSLLRMPALAGGAARNRWIMSCTQEQSDQFYDWPGVDCCFRIEDERFFVEISKGMSARSAVCVVGEIGYGDWAELREHPFYDDPWSAVVDIARWKLPDQSWEREVRLMIEPWGIYRPPDHELIDLVHPNLTINKPFYLPNLKPTFSFAPLARDFISIL